MKKSKDCLDYSVYKEIYESVLNTSFKKIEESVDPCRHFLPEEKREMTNEYVRIAEALEKQIPKKPQLLNADMLCPVCKCYFGHTWGSYPEYSNYCNHCGQAIDWSDVK